MTEPRKPATGPLIMERVIHIEADVRAIRDLLDTHTGAAAQRHTELIERLTKLEKDTEYYGSELIRAYHRLYTLATKLERRLEQLTLPELDLVEEEHAA